MKTSRSKLPQINLTSIREETLDRMIDGYYVLDQDLRYVFMNEAAQRFLPVKKEELIGKKIDDVYPQVFTTTTGKAILKALKTGNVQQLEAYYTSANMWLLNTVFPLREGLAIQVHDISIRKANENNLLFLAKASNILSSSLNYKETITEVVKLAVTTIADWCVVDLVRGKNDLDLLSIMHKDPKKIKLAQKIRKEFPPNESSASRRVLRTGTSEIYPIITQELIDASIDNKRYKQLIQKIGFNSVMIVPFFSKKKPLGVLTFVTSETERQYTPTDLTMAEDLANRISVAIENAKLYEEAQNAVRLRNEFISIASHELKTPVTSVKAYAQMLQRKFMKIGDANSSENLRKMDEQLNKLSLLINDLLDVTKIEAGKLLLHEDFYDFDELILETVESIQHTIEQKIKVLGQTGRKVYGDKERTSQVLINFLSNAAKYSPGSKKIEVILKYGKDTVEVNVRDFGLGITKEKHSKVFERFYRASGPKGETFSGLGLGLYISKEIITRQRGKIWVASEVGKGSTFSFSLPIFKENNL